MFYATLSRPLTLLLAAPWRYFCRAWYTRLRAMPKLGHTDSYTLGMAKVMVSLPDELLARIDLEAKRRSTSRSALLAVAASRELERRGSEEIAQAIARSEERFRQAGPFDAADVVRLERDSRK